MKTKKVSIFLIGILTILLVSCEGSKTYRGSWKAMDAQGKKVEIIFDAKSFVIKDSIGQSKYEYRQNSIEINNSVRTYKIQISDGRNYQINFPNSNNESEGLIKDENGNLLYTIGRDKYTKYEDIYKLK